MILDVEFAAGWFKAFGIHWYTKFSEEIKYAIHMGSTKKVMEEGSLLNEVKAIPVSVKVVPIFQKEKLEFNISYKKQCIHYG